MLISFCKSFQAIELNVTWQEDTPEEPAQIMASVILL